MDLTYCEAPQGQPLDGLVDLVDLPKTIRIIARPNCKTVQPILHDVLASLGRGRDLPSKTGGPGTATNLAVAWSLALGVEAMYLGEAQDLSTAVLHDSLDFAERIGASLCLVFGYGQVHSHAATLRRRGAMQIRYSDLPAPIIRPKQHSVIKIRDAGETDHTHHPIRETHPAPSDDWMTFRAAYRETFDADESRACDALHSATFDLINCERPGSSEELAAVIGALWNRDHCEGHRRFVVARAAQAAMFYQGWNVRLRLKALERYVNWHHPKPLATSHYRTLAAFADPWISAATILHAHRVNLSGLLCLTARAVGADGSVPGLNLAAEARLVMAAQRWVQLTWSSDPNPPLLSHQSRYVRTAIKKRVDELNLPVRTNWRSSENGNFKRMTGLSLEKI